MMMPDVPDWWGQPEDVEDETKLRRTADRMYTELEDIALSCSQLFPRWMAVMSVLAAQVWEVVDTRSVPVVGEVEFSARLAAAASCVGGPDISPDEDYEAIWSELQRLVWDFLAAFADYTPVPVWLQPTPPNSPEVLGLPGGGHA